MKNKLLLVLCAIFLLTLVCCSKGKPETDSYTAVDTADFNTLDYFKDKKIGVVYNYGTDEDLIPCFGAENIRYYNTEGDLIAALTSGRIDAVCIDELIAKRMKAGNPEFTISSANLGRREIGFIFNKEDESGLKDKINMVLTRYLQDGTVNGLVEKWLSDDDSIKTIPEQKWSCENGIIKFGGEFTSDPVAYIRDNQYVGLDLNLILKIAEELHMGVEVTDIPFDSLTLAVSAGKIDIAGSAISYTEERAETVDFSILYQRNPNVLFVIDENIVTNEENLSFFEGLENSFKKNFVEESRWKMVVSGIKITLILSLFSGFFGLLIGFGVCMIRRQNIKVTNGVFKTLVTLIQGTPVVVLLMLLYYVIFGSIDISGIIVAIIGFSINFGAYTSEIMRSGMESVDRGQIEAAYALGYNRFQTFWKILFPQAATSFIPVLKGEFISMVKMTSVVGYIAVQDLTKVSDIIRSRTMEAFFPLIVSAILYFVIAWGFTFLLGQVEHLISPKRNRK